MYLRGKVYYSDFRTAQGQRINKSLGTGDYNLALQKEAILRAKYQENVFDDLAATPSSNSSNPNDPEDFGSPESLLFLAHEHYTNDWQYKTSGEESFTKIRRIAEIFGNLEVNEINYQKIEHLKQVLQKQYGIKQATVNRYLCALSAVLRHALDKGVLRLKPRIKTYKEKEKRIKVYSPQEESAILKAASNDMRDLITVLLQTGARLSEILNLDAQDCNFTTKQIHVWLNKGDRPRSVPMTKQVEIILKKRIQDSTQPFPYTVDHVEHEWQKIRKQLKQAGNREFVIHGLRHTCASRLVRNGIDLYIVKEILGHSSIKITERYAHLDPNQLKSAMETLN